MHIKTLVINVLDLSKNDHIKCINNLPSELENLIIKTVIINKNSTINNLPITLKYLHISQIIYSDNIKMICNSLFQQEINFLNDIRLPFCCEFEKPKDYCNYVKLSNINFKYINHYEDFIFDCYILDNNFEYFPIQIKKLQKLNHYIVYLNN